MPIMGFMDTLALTKAMNLLSLAGNAGASPEEARTAAFLAAKLIKQHGFVLVTKSTPAAKAPAPKAPTPSKAQAPQAAPTSKYRVVVSKIWSHCDKCHKAIKAGDKVSVHVSHLHDLKYARHAVCV